MDTIRDDVWSLWCQRAAIPCNHYGLTRWSRVTYVCVSELTTIDAWTASCHYQNQYLNNVNRTLGNTLQWNIDQNLNMFLQENAFENVVRNVAHFVSAAMCYTQNPNYQSLSHNSLEVIDGGDRIKTTFLMSPSSILQYMEDILSRLIKP